MFSIKNDLFCKIKDSICYKNKKNMKEKMKLSNLLI